MCLVCKTPWSSYLQFQRESLGCKLCFLRLLRLTAPLKAIFTISMTEFIFLLLSINTAPVLIFVVQKMLCIVNRTKNKHTVRAVQREVLVMYLQIESIFFKILLHLHWFYTFFQCHRGHPDNLNMGSLMTRIFQIWCNHGKTDLNKRKITCFNANEGVNPVPLNIYIYNIHDICNL